MRSPRSTKAFISYAHHDRQYATRLAEALMEQGQDVWLDQWEINAGDSLVQKIFAEGLGQAAAFLVILSPASVKSRWVQEELNAMTIRRIEELTRVVPVLIDDVDVPLPLRALRWVDLRSDFERGVREILNGIHGVYERPKLGSLPTHIRDRDLKVGGLSALASQVGLAILNANDPDSDQDRALSGPELSADLEMSPQEVNDGVDELEAHGLVDVIKTFGTAPFQFAYVQPTHVLYGHFSEFVGYNPEEDVRIVVAAIAALDRATASELADRTQLSIGRLNRAVDYVREYALADVTRWLGTHPYSFGSVRATRRTRQSAAEKSM